MNACSNKDRVVTEINIDFVRLEKENQANSI